MLLGCEEVPGWGGASTAGYRLFQALREAGVDATYVNLVDEEDADYFQFVFGEDFGNPRRLSHVRTCVLDGPWYGPHPELIRVIDDASPTVLVGIGHPAAVLLQRAAPERRSVFMATGCQQMNEMIERREAPDYLSIRARFERPDRPPAIRSSDEHEAVVGAHLVLTHSEIVQSLYYSFFSSYIGKIWPEIVGFGDYIYGEARDHASLGRPFAERDIDLLFVASSWRRPEKNYRLVRQIVAALPAARIHIVGEAESRCPTAMHHGFVADRTALFRLMGRARTVVCPSLFDAAPGFSSRPRPSDATSSRLGTAVTGGSATRISWPIGAVPTSSSASSGHHWRGSTRIMPTRSLTEDRYAGWLTSWRWSESANVWHCRKAEPERIRPGGSRATAPNGGHDSPPGPGR